MYLNNDLEEFHENIETCSFKPNKDVLNITGEILNKWYFVTSNEYTNFPSEVSWGFVKYIAIENIRLYILISGENHAISVNTYHVETQQWSEWVQS